MILNKPSIEKKYFLKNKIFPSNTFDSVVGYYPLARQALYSFLRNVNRKTVYLPEFIAGGVYLPIKALNKKIIFYRVPIDLKLDEEYILNAIEQPTDTIFYYVHHFGLYHKENLEIIRNLKNHGCMIIDDRALTLPTESYKEEFDATVYSFYKMTGIPYSGIVKSTTIESKGKLLNYELDDNTSKTITSQNTSDKYNEFQLSFLMKKMRLNLYFYGNPFVKYMPAIIFRIYNKILGQYVNFGKFVDKVRLDCVSEIPDRYRKLLHSLDFGKINNRRKEIAKMYLDNIDNNLLLPVSRDCYKIQSLVGFPILLDEPVKAYRYFMSKGIHTFRLGSGWWWDSSRDYNEIYKHNLLLPAHHHLSNKDVNKIIEQIEKLKTK